MRPICKQCNKNYCAVNYIRNGKHHYRSICDECGSKKTKSKPKHKSWEKAGYKKKIACDNCGFKAVYNTQLTVFHVDSNLKNAKHSNLRTICLNCVEIIKRKEITWKRGDLTVDY